MTKYCKQCGYAILIDGEPADFCSYGCQEVYEAIKQMEMDRAAQ